MKPLALMLAAAFALATPARAQQFGSIGSLADSLAAFKGVTKGVAHAMGAAAQDSVSINGLAVSPMPDISAYPVRGADVSHYQGAIDWTKLKGAGLSFVYIKATEGDDSVDDEFARNWKGASDAGLAKGAYHFYDFCKAGSAQAANFIRTVPAEAGDLPPTVDIEQSRDCAKMPTKAAFQKSLKAFLAKVETAYGRQPVLYVNDSIYKQFLSGADDGLKLWISDPHHQAPVMPDQKPWALWQFSFTGHLAGIAGEVDLDVFNGTPQMLASLTQPSSSPVMLAALP